MNLLEQEQIKNELRLPDIEVPTFMLEFLSYLKKKGRAYGTYVRYGYYLEDFVRWIKKEKNKDVDLQLWKEIKENDYQSYYEYLLISNGYTIESLKRVSSVLMQVYLYLSKMGEKGLAAPQIGVDFIKQFENSDSYHPREFVSEEDFERLKFVLRSKEGLTENQLKGRDMLINRNVAIITLFFKYGLTLQEVVAIKMADLQFVVGNIIEVRGKDDQKRKVKLELDDKLLILNYLEDVPKPVRPKWNRKHHPLFAAFDYQRLTYRWVYNNDDRIDNGNPKELSSLAIQKMILQEVKRAGLEKKKISAQSMRNAAILRLMNENKKDQDVMYYFGLKSSITLRSYKEYLDS